MFSYELLAYRTLINARGPAPTSRARSCRTTSSPPMTSARPSMWTSGRGAEVGRLIDLQDCQRADRLPVRSVQDIYRYAWRQGLKGCTTFRFNPAAFRACWSRRPTRRRPCTASPLKTAAWSSSGQPEVEYDGEVNTAANLFDALKEGYYGKY